MRHGPRAQCASPPELLIPANAFARRLRIRNRTLLYPINPLRDPCEPRGVPTRLSGDLRISRRGVVSGPGNNITNADQVAVQYRLGVPPLIIG